MKAKTQTRTRRVSDTARKVVSFARLWIAFSFLFGAIVAMTAAAFARKEDDREAETNR